MLIIAEEKDAYPPNGQIPNMDTDAKACGDILTRIEPLLPTDLRAEVIGALVTWSESVLKPGQSFGTWAEAITAATRYAHSDPALKTDDSQRRRDQAVDDDEVVKLKAAVGSTGKTGDPQIALRDESRRWANCGMAAFQIRELLHAAGGKPASVSRETYGTGGGDALKKALLVKPVGTATVLLLDCQFPQVHNFIIEVHHDGSRYLAQGYQGTYFAHWWLGINDSYSSKKPTPEILALRERYGLGRAISLEDYATLLDGLVAAVSSDWQETANQWSALPFNPDRQEIDGIRRRSGSPTLLVEVFELGKPAVARAALGDNGVASLSELATRGMATA
ncbi:hypothetical protein MED15_06351 [Micromonospora noduli]|uniref:Uncharacterized protein n=1 Tax=Micromonospora noduli TaxID=709876 RepID=A0ABX9CRZ1_9ACTN|nr:hypothetical protein [Micromonospora noduli]RAO08887.1 hypothetical protein MED15_06351 [Micromonospora noduli]RAO57579.1 hypothetical protein ONO86_00447 [Micromonospora noduli]